MLNFQLFLLLIRSCIINPHIVLKFYPKPHGSIFRISSVYVLHFVYDFDMLAPDYLTSKHSPEQSCFC